MREMLAFSGMSSAEAARHWLRSGMSDMSSRGKVPIPRCSTVASHGPLMSRRDIPHGVG